MSDALAPLLKFVRRHREPAVVQAVRSTAAAVVSYVVALRLSSEPAPLTAPLTALLVVQVTLYSTLTTGVRRVNAVVAGVLIAIGFSALVGLTWWSLGLIILASLVVGRVVRAGEFVPEVAISAMLVLGVTQVADTAWDRVLETLIGAAVGLGFNVLFVPPVWIRPASDAITDLAARIGTLLVHIGSESGNATTVEKAAARLHEARRLDNDISDVDAALRQAEDSLRLNPACGKASSSVSFCAPASTPWRSVRWCCACPAVRSRTSRRRTVTNRPSLHRWPPPSGTCTGTPPRPSSPSRN